MIPNKLYPNGSKELEEKNFTTLCVHFKDQDEKIVEGKLKAECRGSKINKFEDKFIVEFEEQVSAVDVEQILIEILDFNEGLYLEIEAYGMLDSDREHFPFTIADWQNYEIFQNMLNAFG